MKMLTVSIRLVMAAALAMAVALPVLAVSEAGASTLAAPLTAPTITLGVTQVGVSVNIDPQGADLTSGALCYSTTPSDVVDGSSSPVCGPQATVVALTGVSGSAVQSASVLLTGLTAGTEYYYSLETTDSTPTTSVFYGGTFTTYSLATTAGATLGHIKVGASIPSAQVTIGTPSSLAPSDVPAGSVDLTGVVPYLVGNLSSGATLSMTFEVSGRIAPTSVWREANGVLTDITSTSTISGNFVTLSVTDGGPADADGLVNGSISDAVVIMGTVQNQANLSLVAPVTNFTLATRHVVLRQVGGSGTGVISFGVDSDYANSAGCRIVGKTLSPTTAGSCEVVVTKAATAGYYATSSSPVKFTFTFAPQRSLSIANTALSRLLTKLTPLHTVGGSGTGAVTYRVDPSYANTSNCTISGRSLWATTPGSCDVVATKAANAVYSATTSAPVQFSFAYATQSTLRVTNTRLSVTLPASIGLRAAGGSGTGAVSFHLDAGHVNTAGCTLSGSVLSATAAGTCAVAATKASSQGYAATTSAAVVFVFIA